MGPRLDGPGPKLPSLGHIRLKQTFALQTEGFIDGGADSFLTEPSQVLLQTKAAVNGCKQARMARGVLPADQGAEGSVHKSFTMATDMPVYFCDRGSPWQRGSNENTNGCSAITSPRYRPVRLRARGP